MYVQRGIYDEVVDRMAAAARTFRMGGSEDTDVDLGP
jgi:acyl-CoA reductase-like NAD-dependent aldehyde dehydrogenase